MKNCYYSFPPCAL